MACQRKLLDLRGLRREELLKCFADDGRFVGLRRSGQGDSVGEANAVIRRGASFGQNPFGERSSRFEVLNVILKLQCLQRRVAAFS